MVNNKSWRVQQKSPDLLPLYIQITRLYEATMFLAELEANSAGRTRDYLKLESDHSNGIYELGEARLRY